MLRGGPGAPLGGAGPEGVDPAGLRAEVRWAACAWDGRLHMGVAAGMPSMAGGPCLKSGPAPPRSAQLGKNQGVAASGFLKSDSWPELRARYLRTRA